MYKLSTQSPLAESPIDQRSSAALRPRANNSLAPRQTKSRERQVLKPCSSRRVFERIPRPVSILRPERAHGTSKKRSGEQKNRIRRWTKPSTFDFLLAPPLLLQPPILYNFSSSLSFSLSFYSWVNLGAIYAYQFRLALVRSVQWQEKESAMDLSFLPVDGSDLERNGCV